MPIQSDFPIVRFEDGQLTVGMTPPVDGSGWDLLFRVSPRFGSTSGWVIATSASGYSAVSGITTMNSGQGIFRVAINSPQTSGWAPRPYAFEMARTTSGQYTVLAQGFLNLGLNAGSLPQVNASGLG